MKTRIRTLACLMMIVVPVHSDAKDAPPGQRQKRRVDPNDTVAGVGTIQVYRRESEAPVTMYFKEVELRQREGPPGAVRVTAGLAKLQTGSKSTKDEVFGRGILRKKQQFPRVALRWFAENHDHVIVEVSYEVAEGASVTRHAETQQCDGIVKGTSMVVDFAGVRDTTGKQVSSKRSGALTTLHTEREFFSAEIKGIQVKVTDPAGAVLFAGDWGSLSPK